MSDASRTGDVGSRARDGRSDLTDARHYPVGALLICVLAATCELAIVALVSMDQIGLSSGLLLHALVSCGLLALLFIEERRGRSSDLRLLALCAATTAVSGPVGATLSILLGFGQMLRRAPSRLLESWYDRLSGNARENAASELHARIRAGRTINPQIDARAKFSSILRYAPLNDKQRVLSVIAQRYHPQFAPLLQLALHNEEAPIRVQAAAVVARLRGEERRRFKSDLTAALDAERGSRDQRLAAAGKLLERLEMALLDEQDVRAAAQAGVALCQGLLQDDRDDEAASLLLGQIQYHAARYDAAVETLRPLMSGRGGDIVDVYRAACLRSGRYSGLGEIQSAGGEAVADTAVDRG